MPYPTDLPQCLSGAKTTLSLTSKTRETSFQVLNRIVWVNNKAFKSRMRRIPTVTDAGKLKQWNNSCVNALLPGALDSPRQDHYTISELISGPCPKSRDH